MLVQIQNLHDPRGWHEMRENLIGFGETTDLVYVENRIME